MATATAAAGGGATKKLAGRAATVSVAVRVRPSDLFDTEMLRVDDEKKVGYLASPG